MLKQVLYLACITASGAIGYGSADTSAPMAGHATSVTDAMRRPISLGGQDLLNVALQPLSIERDAVTLGISVQSAFQGFASVQYAITVVDDDGELTQEHIISEAIPLAHNETVSVSEQIDGDLPDGFYAIHAVFAGLSADDNSQVVSRDFYFEVASGSATPIDETTYYAYSNAYLAHSEESMSLEPDMVVP